MSLPVFQATIVNEFGEIIPSPVMTILDESTGQPAILFSDRNGTVPLGTNGVFTGGTNGFAQFFAAAGNYRVKAELLSAGFEQTWDFVAMVGDSAFYEVGAGASQIPTNALLPNFGTAAESDTGTGANNVPTNSDLGTAATKDVQTSPTDTTAGALLNNETTHIGGNLNYTGANYQPEDANGIGTRQWLRNNTGGNVLNNVVYSGALLQLSGNDASGGVLSGGIVNGSWRYVGGATVPNGGAGLFLRDS